MEDGQIPFGNRAQTIEQGQREQSGRQAEGDAAGQAVRELLNTCSAEEIAKIGGHAAHDQRAKTQKSRAVTSQRKDGGWVGQGERHRSLERFNRIYPSGAASGPRRVDCPAARQLAASGPVRENFRANRIWNRAS